MYFNHLNYPAAWRAEYSKYPEGLTILESLMQWIRQVDDMVDSHNANQTTINGFSDRLDSFIAQYDTHLQATLTETLTTWQLSGFLDVVIDAALQTEMDNLATTTEQALVSFSSQLTEKANISYVDTKVDAMATGTPKIVVQSVNDLPAIGGTEKLGLVLDDNKKYYDNGTSWIDAGIYQSTGIANGSVDESKLSAAVLGRVYDYKEVGLPLWEFGYYNPNRSKVVTNTRLSITKSVILPKDSKIKISNGTTFKYGLLLYDVVTGDLILDRGWMTTDYILDNDYEVLINLAYQNGRDMTSTSEAGTISVITPSFHIESMKTDITNLYNSIFERLSLFWETGSYSSARTKVIDIKRTRVTDSIILSKGSKIKITNGITLKYGLLLYDVVTGNFISDTGWMTTDYILDNDYEVLINLGYKDDRDMTAKDLINGNNIIIIDNKIVTEKTKTPLEDINTAISSILVEYGRISGASYVFARIPKNLNDGSKLVPKVALTSIDGSLSGGKRSTLRYAIDNDTIFTVNAGLFNMTTNEPVGQLIIDGVSLINAPMTSDNGVPIHADECYPLAIDANGNLTTYQRNADTTDMIANGVKYAVTAWGKLVDNFQIATEDIDNEIVHNGKKYIRQSIGQYQNGDYCICTVDLTRGPVTNEAGLYYEELAQLFVDKGVEFAYSLDGGGSAQTVLGKRQLNPIYERVDGRKVPTVIEFYIA